MPSPADHDPPLPLVEADRADPLLLRPVADAGGLPRHVLLPGDPDRVEVMASPWSDVTRFPLVRGLQAATGRYRGQALAAVSTGMGAPSMEFLLTEAILCGADTAIRVGTTGSLREDVCNGDLVINDACVRMDGSSDAYVRPGFPAAASHEVTAALIAACQEHGVRYHVGTGATSASFFVGQDRANPAGYAPPGRGALLEELRAARVLNLEMEGATLLTLARLFGIRAGVISTVIANRVTGAWGDEGGIERVCEVAATAVTYLNDGSS